MFTDVSPVEPSGANTCGFEGGVSTAPGWMDHYDIWYNHVPLRMDLNCNNLGVPFTFHQVPSAGCNFKSSLTPMCLILWLMTLFLLN